MYNTIHGLNVTFEKKKYNTIHSIGLKPTPGTSLLQVRCFLQSCNCFDGKMMDVICWNTSLYVCVLCAMARFSLSVLCGCALMGSTNAHAVDR